MIVDAYSECKPLSLLSDACTIKNFTCLDFAQAQAFLKEKLQGYKPIDHLLYTIANPDLIAFYLLVHLSKDDTLWQPVPEEPWHSSPEDLLAQFENFLKVYGEFLGDMDCYLAGSTLPFKTIETAKEAIETRLEAASLQWTEIMHLRDAKGVLLGARTLRQILEARKELNGHESLWLGLIYLKTEDMKKSAPALIKFAAEKRIAMAEYVYANLEPFSSKWLKQAAVHGYSYAQYRYATDFLDQYTKEGFAKAREWYGRAAVQNDPRAQNALGFILTNHFGGSDELKEAHVWLQKSANLGDLHGICNLGLTLLIGLGVPKDEIEGFRYIQKAAEGKLPEAQRRLGLCYRNGQGVIKDVAQAIKWFEEASAAGDERAPLLLGNLYSEGKEVKQDKNVAANWYWFAAEKKNHEAAYLLAMLHVENQKENEAIPLLIQAATGNHIASQTRSQVQLGIILSQSERSREDHKDAVKWLKLAIAKGSVQAMNILGTLLLEGCSGIEPNIKEARALFKRAADLNDGLAEYHLGMMALFDSGTLQSEIEALRWFRQAYAHNFQEAKVKIDELEARLKVEETDFVMLSINPSE